MPSVPPRRTAPFASAPFASAPFARAPFASALFAAALLAVLFALGACSGDATATQDPASPAADDSAGTPIQPGTTGTVVLGERPFTLTVPEGYDPATPMPLVVALHSYTSDGEEFAGYLGLAAQSTAKGFLLAIPEGTADDDGAQFWNATSACCDFIGSDVDDSEYLADVIRSVEANYAVDPDRVVVVGHSNGGFMALRMACDHADLVTAVASIAGAQTGDASACEPAAPVSVLQVHGDSDETIAYDGGSNGPGRDYPGAAGTVDAWRTLDGCTGEPEGGVVLDLDQHLAGSETTPTTWGGCDDGVEVALWTIEGGGHVPAWSEGAPQSIVQWLLDHPRES